MSRKGITQGSVGSSTRRPEAELTILLVDENRQAEPVRYQSRPNRLAERWKQVALRLVVPIAKDATYNSITQDRLQRDHLACTVPIMNGTCLPGLVQLARPG